MASQAQRLREKAKKLYDQSGDIKDANERSAAILLALELETEADILEREQGVTQVQQQGTQPPPPLSGSSQAQPAQQQQQAQPKEHGARRDR